MEPNPKLRPAIEFPIIFNAAYTVSPKDFMEKWFELYKDSTLVRNGVIWLHKDQADAAAHGKELEKELTGIEPIETGKPGKPIPDRRARTLGTGMKVAGGEQHTD